MITRVRPGARDLPRARARGVASSPPGALRSTGSRGTGAPAHRRRAAVLLAYPSEPEALARGLPEGRRNSMIFALSPRPEQDVLVDEAPACPGPRQHPRPPRPGEGALRAVRSGEETALVACRSAAPLRLLAPRARGRAAWVIAASHGGGLVDGDAVDLDVEIGAGATLLVGTQAETKVFRCPRLGARQSTRARVADGGLLALVPDPVSPYAGARLAQRQDVDLGAGGSLLLVDAVTGGRMARGERWRLARHESRIEVTAAGRLVLADALRLAAGEGPPLDERLAGIELLATVVLLGPRLAPSAAALVEALGAAPADGGAPVLAAASPLEGGALLRLAARTVEDGLAAIRRHLAFLPALVGEDPLSRRP